jgi:hypothetical protein
MLISLALYACDAPEKPASRDEDGVTVTAIVVEPAEALVTSSPAGATPVDFEARATLDDGSEVLLDGVEWTLSNRSIGTIDSEGTVTPSTENGGVSYVTARFAGVEARATLSVTWSDAIVDGDVSPSVFRGAEQPIENLWLYPPDNVTLPRNTPSIVFQWNDIGAEAYRLRFRGATTDLSVYTRSTSWTADEELWQTISATNAGGSLTVDLAGVSGGTIYAAETRTVNVNRFDSRGSIYYWSTSAQGIMQIPWGEQARDFLTAGNTGRCIGCHDIGPSGLIAFSYDGGDAPTGIKNVADGSDAPGSQSFRSNFKTFSPDGRFLLTSFQGALIQHDVATGTELWEVPVDGWATHVDWAPDGNDVVAVVAGSASCDWVFTGGSLILMEHIGDGTFNTPRVLYTPPAGMNAYYPTFSPDGEWIAFNVSSEDAYDDATATLYVISRAGGEPVALGSANMSDGLYNSWPRWGPLPDDSVMWLAFSSRRLYGNRTSGNPQIWVTAFDPQKARRGEDPSWPAFWLPGQDVGQGNHIPVWAE